MRRTTREPERDPAASRILLGSGGAVLAGVLFVAWGYLDQENAPLYFYDTAHVLAFIVPLLFMVGLATLYARVPGRTTWPGKIGIIIASIGSALGTLKALVKVAVPTLYSNDAVSGRLLRPLDVWTPTLFAGLLLGGLALTATRTSRSLGALLLAMGIFGWAYYLTDSGAILEDRLIHVGFGLLFCLGWIALGFTLWLGSCKPTMK